MARRIPPDAQPRLSNPPSNVRVTVVPGSRGHSVRDRSKMIRAALGLPMLLGLIALVAATGAIVAVVSLSEGGTGKAVAVRSVPPANAGIDPRDELQEAVGPAGMVGVAAAYRYPLGCLGITLSAERSSMLGRRSPCWRYGVYVTAVLREVDGVWRLALEATSPKCPAVVLPAIIRSALAVCRRAAPPPPAARNVR